MGLPVEVNPLFLENQYAIQRSLRFRSSATAYLSKTYASAGNTTTYTLSMWVKRGQLFSSGSTQDLFFPGTNSTFGFGRISNDELGGNLRGTGATNYFWNTLAVFRDVGSWYHIILAIDTTQTTLTNQVKLYVNGVLQSITGTACPQNTAQLSTATRHIGAGSGPSAYFDGYLAEVNFIDGQALTPSSFGQYNEFGVWSPRKYGGSYGTNGFYLPFTDTTSATTLCYDKSNGTGALTTPYAASLSGTNSGWAQFGIRSVITMANVTQQGKSVRVTFAGGSSGLTIYGAAFGKQATSGNAWDFSGDQVTLTFSGSTSATVSANSTLASDWVPYSSGVIASGTYVVALAVGVAAGTTQFGTSTVGTANLYYKSGDYNVGALTTAPSGYTLQSSVPYFFAQVDVQGNNWTPNNISTTAGVNYDAMTDVPPPSTIQNVAAGNYPTWNPLSIAATYANANLSVTTTNSSAPYNAESTMKTPSSGKWYAEITLSAKGAGNPAIGIGNNNPDQFACYRVNGTYVTGSMGASSTGTPATFTTNDVIGVAFDADNGTLNFYKNGSLQTGGFTGITAGNYSFILREDSASGDGAILNCGQRPFTYSNYGTDRPAATFLPLNSNNLPAPTIPNGAKVMAATLYTGDGSASRSISNQTNSGANFNQVPMKPDLVWFKSRNNAISHRVFDVLRNNSDTLVTNSANAESTGWTNDFQGYNNDGFTVGTGTGLNLNTNTYTMVAWQWQAGTAPTVNNTAGAGNVPTAGSVKINGADSTSALAGSIAATRLSANTIAGFSVVTYTGNGANATVGHGLGVAPSMVIVKQRNGVAANWIIWQTALAGTDFLQFDTNAKQTAANVWNSTVPDSTKFSIGTNVAVNTNTNTYVAYCWAPVAGYSAFGSYTGNGSADGPFVYCGFRPRFVLIKCSSTGGVGYDWIIHDTSRDPYNLTTQQLAPDLADAESTAVGAVWDILSNGFKIRNTGNAVNASSATYIYAAFAENPFKLALAR